MSVDQWAARWRIPPDAVADLYRTLTYATRTPPIKGTSEAAVQASVRLEAASKGVQLWRNNVGSLLDQRGIPVRYGLANESKAENTNIKSGDLIGIRPVRITQQHVGRTIGQFVSREIKHHNWHWRGDRHEMAQARWALIVAIAGGDALIVNSTGSL